ncbi:hypothetical protein ACFU3K_44135, partial [Streptomyces shenzhenensis]
MTDSTRAAVEGRWADGPAGPDAVLLGFVRALRAAGVDASTERLYAFLRAVDVLRPGVRADVHAAGRAIIFGGRDEIDRFL